jgi:hypothetical protein
MTVPGAKVDGMELPKAERGLGRADRDGDQTLRIASFGRFVFDPRGVERSGRPQNDNRFRVLERLLDFAIEP